MKKKGNKDTLKNLILSIKKFYEKRTPAEKKLIVVLLAIVVLYSLAALKPLVIDNAIERFSNQSDELKKAEQDKARALTLINQYMVLRNGRQEIEKNFEKNSFKEGHLQYCKSLSTSDMERFDIGQEQVRPFGKDFTRTTFKINFQAPSLSTIVGYIKKLENEKRKYLMSELSIKKSYNRLGVVIEVNSIEKKK